MATIMRKIALSDYEELMANLWGTPVPAPQQESVKRQPSNGPQNYESLLSEIKQVQPQEPKKTLQPSTSYASRSEKQISGLDYRLQPLARKFIDTAAKYGIPVVITEGYRSNERQAELYQQGRNTKGPVVTKAKPGTSKHNYGVAFDVALLDENGNITWKNNPSAWDTLGAIGRSLGLQWGGNFRSFTDKPHFELPVSLQDLISGRFVTQYNRVASRLNILKKIAMKLILF